MLSVSKLSRDPLASVILLISPSPAWLSPQYKPLLGRFQQLSLSCEHIMNIAQSCANTPSPTQRVKRKQDQTRKHPTYGPRYTLQKS